MALTTAQLQALKTNIAANAATLQVAIDQRNHAVIAAFYNSVAAPDFIVWRTNIKSSEVVAVIVGTEFVALTALKQQMLMLLLVPGTVDASSPNIQADFGAIFSAGTTLTALAALAKRKATVAEKLLATGTGSTGSPATMGFEGSVSSADALNALDS